MVKPNLPLLDWKAAVVPDLRFLSMEPKLAVYGKILRVQSDGYLWAWCYTHLHTSGEESKLHRSELAIPLSIEQFQIARRLGWPSNEAGITRILSLPPN